MAETTSRIRGTEMQGTGSQGQTGTGAMRGGTQGSMTGQGRTSQEAEQHSEGWVARTIEDQTAKLPSDVFLWAAIASIGGSLFLQFSGRKEESLFVGQWAPTLLILGLYNKIVKVAGSDRLHNSGQTS